MIKDIQKSLNPKSNLLCVIICIVSIGILCHLNILNMDSIYPYILFLFLYAFLVQIVFNDKNRRLSLEFCLPYAVGACVLATLTTLGSFKIIAEKVGWEEFSKKTILYIVIYMVGYSIMYYFCIAIMDKLVINFRNECDTGESKIEISNKNILVFAGICMVAWMPYFTALWPGVLTNDSIDEMKEVLKIESYSNHHPWIHMLTIKLFYSVGEMLFHNVNAGVAAYTVASMMIMAVIYGFVIEYTIKRNNLSKQKKSILVIVEILFFAFLPINAVYSMTMWKDIFFAGIILLFMIWLDAAEGNLIDLHRMKWWLFYITLTFLFCVYRSNGKYAFLLMCPFILMKLKKYLKRLMFSTICSLIFVAIYSKIILPCFEVQPGDIVEMLSVPEQQIAYVISFEEEDIKDEELCEIDKVMPVEKVSDKYIPHISNPIKQLMRGEGDIEYLKTNILRYAKIYWDIGKRNIYKYIVAFAEQTKGYYYHRVTDWICATEIAENDLGIARPNADSSIREKIVSLIDKTSELFNYYWSIGLDTYIIIICMIIAWRRKGNLLIYLPNVAILITLMLATPVAAEFRYAYSMFLAVPVLLPITAGISSDAIVNSNIE